MLNSFSLQSYYCFLDKSARFSVYPWASPFLYVCLYVYMYVCLSVAFSWSKFWNCNIAETVKASVTCDEMTLSTWRFWQHFSFLKLQMNSKLFLQICLHLYSARRRDSLVTSWQELSLHANNLLCMYVSLHIWKLIG